MFRINKLFFVTKWLTASAIATVTTGLAVWLLSQPEAVSQSAYASLLTHRGFLAGTVAMALLPWWTLAVVAIDQDKQRGRREKILSGSTTTRFTQADWLKVMQFDRRRRGPGE